VLSLSQVVLKAFVRRGTGGFTKSHVNVRYRKRRPIYEYYYDDDYDNDDYYEDEPAPPPPPVSTLKIKPQIYLKILRAAVAFRKTVDLLCPFASPDMKIFLQKSKFTQPNDTSGIFFRRLRPKGVVGRGRDLHRSPSRIPSTTRTLTHQRGARRRGSRPQNPPALSSAPKSAPKVGLPTAIVTSST